MQLGAKLNLTRIECSAVLSVLEEELLFSRGTDDYDSVH